jgi:hypothetical protein
MEPRKQKEDLEQTQEARSAEKKRRFRIVKLEERIAPAKGGNYTQQGIHCAHGGFSGVLSVE